MQRARALFVGFTLAAAASAATAVGTASFLGAPAGVAVAFTTVPLPDVAILPPGDGSPVAGKLDRSPWAPSIDALLNGEVVVRSEAQMKSLWAKLFAAPYDPSLFDFSTSFVVFMGGGAMALGSFDISDVEQVNAQYASDFGPGGGAETFLSVTSTTF